MGEFVKSGEQTMSSLEIADATGRRHKHIMESIRKMEPAWKKVHGTTFRLMSREIEIGNGAKRRVPCYELTKLESLYIATKFKDVCNCLTTFCGGGGYKDKKTGMCNTTPYVAIYKETD